MRELTDHAPPGADQNRRLKVSAIDETSFGGASHNYGIVGLDHGKEKFFQMVTFQAGPIKEHGVNGVTNEALIAIVLDRLRGFQAGPHACPENNSAIVSLQNALDMLHRRTNDRQARGVEGTGAL
jgi:hypothetical protein